MKRFSPMYKNLSSTKTNTYRQSSKSGFSIIELLVMSAVLGGMALAVSKLGVDVYKFQRNTLSTSEANEFSSAIGYYLNQNCQSELQGKVFPLEAPDNSVGPEDLVLTKYGTWGNTAISEIKEGVEFEDKWKVKKLTWEHKSSIPAKDYKRSGQDLQVVVARIVLEMEVMQESSDLSMNHYSIEIPFIVDKTTQKVVDCLAGSLGPVGEDMCGTMGAEYDPIMDMCMPKNHCFLVTQFVNCTSNKGWNPTFSSSSPCEELILPHITLGGKKQYFDFYHNDGGGELGNCPDGTKMIFTGNIVKMGSISCGPGCSNTYASEGKVYLCVKCDMP